MPEVPPVIKTTLLVIRKKLSVLARGLAPAVQTYGCGDAGPPNFQPKGWLVDFYWRGPLLCGYLGGAIDGPAPLGFGLPYFFIRRFFFSACFYLYVRGLASWPG
jgi:hypothetical protein